MTILACLGMLTLCEVYFLACCDIYLGLSFYAFVWPVSPETCFSSEVEARAGNVLSFDPTFDLFRSGSVARELSIQSVSVSFE